MSDVDQAADYLIDDWIDYIQTLFQDGDEQALREAARQALGIEGMSREDILTDAKNRGWSP